MLISGLALALVVGLAMGLLGVVLLVVSFLYQKRLAASRTQDKL